MVPLVSMYVVLNTGGTWVPGASWWLRGCYGVCTLRTIPYYPTYRIDIF